MNTQQQPLSAYSESFFLLPFFFKFYFDKKYKLHLFIYLSGFFGPYEMCRKQKTGKTIQQNAMHLISDLESLKRLKLLFFFLPFHLIQIQGCFVAHKIASDLVIHDEPVKRSVQPCNCMTYVSPDGRTCYVVCWMLLKWLPLTIHVSFSN